MCQSQPAQVYFPRPIRLKNIIFSSLSIKPYCPNHLAASYRGASLRRSRLPGVFLLSSHGAPRSAHLGGPASDLFLENIFEVGSALSAPALGSFFRLSKDSAVGFVFSKCAQRHGAGRTRQLGSFFQIAGTPPIGFEAQNRQSPGFVSQKTLFLRPGTPVRPRYSPLALKGLYLRNSPSSRVRLIFFPQQLQQSRRHLIENLPPPMHNTNRPEQLRRLQP